MPHALPGKCSELQPSTVCGGLLELSPDPAASILGARVAPPPSHARVPGRLLAGRGHRGRPRTGWVPFLCTSRLAICSSVSETSWPSPQDGTWDSGRALPRPLPLPPGGPVSESLTSAGSAVSRPSSASLPPTPVLALRRNNVSPVTGLPGPHFVLSQLSSKATPSPAMGVPCSPLFMEVAPGFGNVSEPVAVTATGAGGCGIS